MIYAFPRPVSASHGLIMTLRLYNLNKVKTKKNAEILEDVRLGLETYVEADGVERETRQGLKDICQKVWDECDKTTEDIYMTFGRTIFLDSIKEGRSEEEQLEFQNSEIAMKTVAAMWEERKVIARKLKTGIAAGQRIWD